MIKRLTIAVAILLPTIGFGQTLRRSEIVLVSESSYSMVKQVIKEAITGWMQKGEFERTYEYENRIKSQFRQAFDSICFEVVQTVIQEKSAVQFELLKYNADTEKFGVRFSSDDVSWRDSLFVPLRDAPEFKENVGNVEILVDDAEWVFIDNQLMPSKVKVVRDQDQITFRYPKTNTREISFTPSELGLSALNGKNLQFNYRDYYTEAVHQTTLKKRTTDNWDNTREEKVFEKVEIEASVNIAQWRRHLENQLVRYIEDAASSGMAPGNYTVNVRFLVELDGNVVDIRALNDPGYGLAQGAVELVKRGPKWTPGEQNGRKVRSYHTQPITFQIQN